MKLQKTNKHDKIMIFKSKKLESKWEIVGKVEGVKYDKNQRNTAIIMGYSNGEMEPTFGIKLYLKGNKWRSR
mgnify:CR=1 FL=1